MGVCTMAWGVKSRGGGQNHPTPFDSKRGVGQVVCEGLLIDGAALSSIVHLTKQHYLEAYDGK